MSDLACLCAPPHPAALQGGLGPRKLPVRVTSCSICSGMKTVLNYETFHAKPGMYGHSTLLRLATLQGQSQDMVGRDESNTRVFHSGWF